METKLVELKRTDYINLQQIKKPKCVIFILMKSIGFIVISITLLQINKCKSKIYDDKRGTFSICKMHTKTNNL